MLQSLRDNLKGTAATIIVVFIALSFGLVGLETLFAPSRSGSEAASVNDETITENELARAVQFQKQRLEAQFGGQAPANLISPERLREPVLNDLIQRLVTVQAAVSEGMAASDSNLDEMIRSMEQFQQDGQFSPELFTQLLRMQGYTPAMYKRLLAQDVLLNQHTSGINNSGFATENDLHYIAELSLQQRSFYYLTIPIAATKDAVELSDGDIQTYYEEHVSEYQSPEQVVVEYVELSPSALMRLVDVTDAEILQQYEQEATAFEAQTQRQAAHILIEAKDDDSEQSLIEEVRARLKNGEDFATLAQEYSDDIGSKEQGGDLGYTRGDTFPEAFELALAVLEVGAVSAPVETDSGLHLIKLLNIQETEVPDFEQEKDKIQQALLLAQAEELFVELVERLRDLAYNADNLAEVAEQLGVEVGTSELFTRTGGAGLFANREVLDAAFSDDVLIAGNTSDVLELAENNVVVLRVTEHQKAHTKPLDDVKDVVTSTLTQTKAEKILVEKGDVLKKRLGEGQSVEDIAKAEGYEWQVSLDSRRTEAGVNRQVLQHVFELARPLEDQPVVSGLNLHNGDYVLLSLTAVKAGDFVSLAKEQQVSMHSQISNQYSNLDFSAYEDFLKQQADIDIK